jgi:tetratricopeptide (TPR) repeat protein
MAQESYDMALKDNPNEALALLLKGAMKAYQNAPEEAVEYTEVARKLTPLGPQSYYFDALAACAHLTAGHYQRAIDLADRSLQANSGYPSTLRTKVIALEMCGREAEARDVAKTLLSAAPDFTVRRYRREHPAAVLPVGRDWARALRAAGVPE